MELSNNHNVYILGAGFSRDRGFPLVSEFLMRMRDSADWLQQQHRDAEVKAVRNVLQFRQEAASAAYWTRLDLENIEELFSLASATPKSSRSDIRIAIAATLDYCAHIAPARVSRIPLVDLEWPSGSDWIDQADDVDRLYSANTYDIYVASLLGMLLTGKPQGTNTFISFNYDAIVEASLRRLNITFGYGFGKGSVNYDASAIASPKNYEVPVLKLHGSTNWGSRQGKGRAFTVFRSYENVRASGIAPEIVPPTWDKVFEKQLIYVWEAAIHAIENATRIVVIGFSIPQTDMHFKYLMAAGLKQSISLREIMFVNPNADELKERATELLRNEYIENGRISFLPMGLDEYCQSQDILKRIDRPLPPGFSLFPPGR